MDSIGPPRRRLFHRLGKFEIEFGQSTSIMSIEFDLDPRIDIEPFRMVVQFLRRKRCLRHETESLDEAGEFEGLGNGCGRCIERPTRKRSKFDVDSRPFQFFPFHAISSIYPDRFSMKRVSILFVCMGNICRSPLAEGIFTRITEEAGAENRYSADSAGTGGWHQGDPPDRRSIATAKSHGIDISGQRARRIRHEDFTDFDLILGMDRANVAELRKIAPTSANIHLFADFALGTGEDIADPYYGGPDGFELIYTRLFTGCSKLFDRLGADGASLSGKISSVR